MLGRLQIYGIYALENLRSLPMAALADFLPAEAHKRRHEELSRRRNGRIALRTQLVLSMGNHISLEEDLETYQESNT